MNENPAPSLEDVGLSRIAGTSGLNSHDGSSGKEKPSGDFVNPDWLHKSQMIVVPKIIMTKPTRPDQRGSTRVRIRRSFRCLSTKFKLEACADDPIPYPPIITKPAASKKMKHLRRIVTNAKRFNPMAKQFKAFQEKVEKQQRKMDNIIANKVPAAVKELVYAQVNTQVKNHASTLVQRFLMMLLILSKHVFIKLSRMFFVSSKSLSLHHLLYLLPTSQSHNKQVVPKDSRKKANLKKRTHDDQDPPENHEGEKRYKKSRFAGQSSSRKDQAMPDYTHYKWTTRPDAKDRFNEVVDTYPDLDEPEDGEIIPNNSTLTLAKRIKSKAEYDYNMDQMTIAMSNYMDWELDHGLGVDSKEPLSLIGPELSQRIPLEHLKISKDIGKLFRKTLVSYDIDAMLGIHHWEKMKRLAYRGKRAVTYVRKVYLDLKITFVDEVIVDDLYEYRFLESITVTRADKKKYTLESQ
ncbi:hypothetical protein Tco_1463843 [Tanacetum coccineum]